jgi:hypothetical protein
MILQSKSDGLCGEKEIRGQNEIRGVGAVGLGLGPELNNNAAVEHSFLG